MLLSLASGDESWAMVDQGPPKDRIPDAIAHTMELIVEDLRKEARK